MTGFHVADALIAAATFALAAATLTWQARR